ncbi:hypothetical protein PbJCM13498_31660 [Prolixibacter bellariivorans]|uniref:Uncharacterized protein n=1 Tax=Prolixibacter bellariivorans TaxID=314319 RepID=A0A5M4B3B7_9BACT|nr:hypothetical protein PbJCM13498_31660 [Prolixibacter bellariivorans]
MIFYAPFWSFILVKWQIWSLNKIYDFETFIELAQKRALIYPQEHFYSKYAIALKKDKDLLKELILKGENSNRLEILREKYQFKTVLFYKKLSRLFNTLPILELSIEGVLLNGKGVINWTDFQYIEPKTSGGKYPDFWIEYQLKKTNKIEIYKLTNLKGGLLRLEYFFKLYKQLATTINIRNAGRCAKFEP